MNKRVLALCTGGLDSTIGIFKAIDMGYDVRHAIIFNYGQRAFFNEWNASHIILGPLGIPVVRVDLPFMLDFDAGLQNNIPVVKSEAESKADKYSPAWFPNRNMILISIAAAYARKFNCDRILFGMDADDTIPDIVPDFVDFMNLALGKAMPDRLINLYTPLAKMTRYSMVRWGLEYNERSGKRIPWHAIWSCRNAGSIQCGECNPCFVNFEAFKDAPKEVRKAFGMKGLE